MNIPFLDLKTQFRAIEHEVLPMVKEAMENAAFIGGPQVSGFETEFATFCDSKYCVGVNSGTDALRFALMAAGVGPGDEVITVPHTFIATTEAVSQVGAKPVFVDIDLKTYNMDPNKLEDYLAKRPGGGSTGNKPRATSDQRLATSNQPQPKAVLPVHLYGQPADMDPILEIAKKKNLVVIEDACQAHGSQYKGRKAGSMGAIGCFSFYPGKNLGAYGEGGAVVTQDEEMASKIRMIRDHGQTKKYYHDMEGYNGRLDAIQAGVLRIKLKRLAAWNESRRQNAQYYNELLSSIKGVTIPKEADGCGHVYHLYVILVEDRDGLQKYLNEKGIGTGLHYPVPLHLQKAYANQGHKEGDFPVTESVAKRLLSLPMFPELTKAQIEYVADCIKQFMTKK
jgi:dTDP-4-amino-4,6-dideoxygalactose transaminase